MMQFFVLLLLSLSASLASAYQFSFEVSIQGPEHEVSGCNDDDLKKFFKGLKRKFEIRGNDYLMRKNYEGIFVDIDIVPQFRRALSEDITKEELDELEAVNDEELEENIHHRGLWGYGWSGPGTGSCRHCGGDNDGGRRNLRSLKNAKQIIKKSEFDEWMNKKMPIFMKKIVESRGVSEECKASADQWTGTFEWREIIG